MYISNLKGVTPGGDKVKKPETEEERRARVRRRSMLTLRKYNFFDKLKFFLLSFLKDGMHACWKLLNELKFLA